MTDSAHDRRIVRLVETLCPWLTTNGMLILGQIVPPAFGPDPFGTEGFLDWEITFRTPEELRRLLDRTWARDRIRIEGDERGKAVAVVAGEGLLVWRQAMCDWEQTAKYGSAGRPDSRGRD